jgi:hypothetical protein
MKNQLIEKHGVKSECLTDLLKYLNPEQIDSLLGSVGKAAGEKKQDAYAALPKAAAALEKARPDADNTVSVLVRVAELAKEETGLSFGALADPAQAKSLQDLLEYGLAEFFWNI